MGSWTGLGEPDDIEGCTLGEADDGVPDLVVPWD